MEENLMGMDTLVDPFVIKVIICDEINKDKNLVLTYEQLKEYVKSLNIKITKEEIVSYLDNEFEKECPELKLRINNDNYSNFSDKFSDRLKAQKYVYSEDTTEYFNRYIDILRNKSLKLLGVVDLLIAIKNRKVDNLDTSILTELDIETRDGCILYKDMIRLVKPLVENIMDLIKYVDTANNVNSYLHININKDLIYLSGGSFNELFPKSELQVMDIECDKTLRGMVPLSDNQKKKWKEKCEKNYSYVLSLLDDLK